MGDFNYPKIDWQLHYTPGGNSEENYSIACIEDNYLVHHLDEPTRCRDDEPHTIDLIFSQDEFSDIE